jgi:monofunctional glycosyltransferase
MRWLRYFLKCIFFIFIAMQGYFALQITLWSFVNPSTTAFQHAERWRLCGWHWSCPIESSWTPYQNISNNLKRAVLVSEDDIFFQHMGIRFADMQKAWQKNQQGSNPNKTVLRGGSTITQQLAKNLFLSSSQNYLRKAQELIIAGLLEIILSKQRLFEIYLNSVEWGEGIFGISSAARHYYGVSPQYLTREQAAALASALPAPKCFDKQQYCRRSQIHFPTRQNFILENMDRVSLGSPPRPKKP